MNASHFTTSLPDVIVPLDDPILQRPESRLPYDHCVDAARVLRDYPDAPELRQFAKAIVTLRLTEEEFAAIMRFAAQKRNAGDTILRCPVGPLPPFPVVAALSAMLEGSVPPPASHAESSWNSPHCHGAN